MNPMHLRANVSDFLCEVRMTKAELAKYIDSTLLDPKAGTKQIDKLCDEALKYGFASVCILPMFVKRVAKRLAKTEVAVCTVIDFPFGSSASGSKGFQSALAVQQGAQEVDIVFPISAVLENNMKYVHKELETIVSATRRSLYTSRSVIIKFILETCYLSDEQIVACCEAAVKCGADFVKTSTGFAKARPSGATVHAVELMRKTVGNDFGVKASGGIRDTQTALAMIAAGANRIGTSSGKAIVDGLPE